RRDIGDDVVPPAAQQLHQPLQIAEVLVHLLDGNEVEVADDFRDVQQRLIQPPAALLVATELAQVPGGQQDAARHVALGQVVVQPCAKPQQPVSNITCSVRVASGD